jgi:hypothetical protein
MGFILTQSKARLLDCPFSEFLFSLYLLPHRWRNCHKVPGIGHICWPRCVWLCILAREAFEYFISILFFLKAPAMTTFYFLLQKELPQELDFYEKVALNFIIYLF